MLIAGLVLILAGPVTAQTFKVLHSFTGGSDGANPQAGLVLSSNTLYGTSIGPYSGAGYAKATVFKVKADGTGFTTLHTFPATSSSYPYANSDGAAPNSLILSGNILYGTATHGGSSGKGTVFRVNIDGTGFTNLHTFTSFDANSANGDGAYPSAGLILSSNTLYGTTSSGGSAAFGTVFAVETDGTGFRTLHNFAGGSDGANPIAQLMLSSNTLYGTAEGFENNGIFQKGTLFKVNKDGTGFKTLHNFTVTSGPYPGTNPDGAAPGGLILSANTLYGAAIFGGAWGWGTVFKVNADGTGFTTLHSFAAFSSNTNSDGIYPAAGLILSGATFYGTAHQGGSSGKGTVFKVNTDGTGFATLHTFAATSNGLNSDGAYPSSGLILSSNTLYGTTGGGGSSGNGTLFSLSVPTPQLAVLRYGANAILTWPSDATGFALQSTTNLSSTPVWATVSTGPVVVNGLYAVTNPITGSRKFYRLSH